MFYITGEFDMPVLPAEIPTGLVKGQFYYTTADGSDGDTNPEVPPASGYIRFTSSAPVIRMPGKNAIVIPTFIDGKLNTKGELVSLNDSSAGVRLPATDSDLLSPTRFTWQADFHFDLDPLDHVVHIPSFSFKVPTGGTVDLTSVMPVAESNGVQIIQGPEGKPGPNTVPTNEAVDQRIAAADIPAIVARTIAAQPTVAAAAAAAVDANPKIASIEQNAVFSGDSRLMQSVETETAQGFAVVDRHDRIIFTPGKSTASEAPVYPTPDWAHWGDSMTDDQATKTDAWVAKFAAVTGRNHYNGGWYGQQAAAIAARQGGLPARVTVAGGSIPASGTVGVTATPKPVHPSPTRYLEGTLAGVPGRLREVTDGTVTFTRDAPGSVVAVPPGTLFFPANTGEMAARHVTIWVGRNDVYYTAPDLIVAAVQQMIDYLTPRVKRVLVMEVPPGETTSATHRQVLAINDALKAAFPAYWAPVSAFLRTPEAATGAGITFTADDQADITAGLTPRSFRSDGVHLNAAGCRAVAKYVEAEAIRRNWL